MITLTTDTLTRLGVNEEQHGGFAAVFPNGLALAAALDGAVLDAVLACKVDLHGVAMAALTPEAERERQRVLLYDAALYMSAVEDAWRTYVSVVAKADALYRSAVGDPPSEARRAKAAEAYGRETAPAHAEYLRATEDTRHATSRGYIRTTLAALANPANWRTPPSPEEATPPAPLPT